MQNIHQHSLPWCEWSSYSQFESQRESQTGWGHLGSKTLHEADVRTHLPWHNGINTCKFFKLTMAYSGQRSTAWTKLNALTCSMAMHDVQYYKPVIEPRIVCYYAGWAMQHDRGNCHLLYTLCWTLVCWQVSLVPSAQHQEDNFYMWVAEALQIGSSGKTGYKCLVLQCT